MNLKTLSLIVPLVTTGWLGFCGVASAAKFSDTDVLSITLPAFQINAAGIPGIAGNLPTGEANGNDTGPIPGLADALFGTSEVKDLSDSNRVMDNPKTGKDYVPGDLGEFNVDGGPGTTGGFNNYEGQSGEIRSFDGFFFNQLEEVNGGFLPPATSPNPPTDALPPGFFPDNYLISLGTGGDELRFYLSQLESFNLLESLASGFGELEGMGFLVAKTDSSGVDYYRVTYELSSQALQDNGIDPDQAPGDGVTGAPTASATLRIKLVPEPTGEVIPEPSTLLGLSAVAGVSALIKKNKLKKEQ